MGARISTLFAALLLLFPAAGAGAMSLGKWHVGAITKEQLYGEHPEYSRAAEQYAPNGQIVEKIRGWGQRVRILVFLGTWCPHSRSEVPKFLKVVDLAANPNLSVSMIALGPEMKDGEGMAENHTIRRVPTFVFLRDGREIGRIVEFPRRSMEEDFWGILSEGSSYFTSPSSLKNA